MISQTSSISSSLGNCKSLFKEKDYDLIHYFDDQSDNETEKENNKNKMVQEKISKISAFKENDEFTEDNLYSSSEDNFFNYDEESISDSNEKVIEKSPDGNFGKVNNFFIIFIFLFFQYDEILQITANKTVYKGYDYNVAREIAWCEIRLNKNNLENAINKITSQINLLKSINEHQNLLKYINSWYDNSQNVYIIIEELCSGGNINSNYKYIRKPKLKLIKKWIKEILTALDYLHSNNIIHHDIKCENIYLDRISGNLKVGCMGSIEKLPSGVDHFEKYAGTPEFMAPEVNEGKYNFKADIYSLGLSLIELLTVQKPYKECEGALDIYINKKKGNLPESFKLITDKGIREFIMLCLNKENKRPSAKELLEKNKWLNDKKNCENNSIIEIKGSLRQKNFYLNNKYKSGGIIDVKRLSNKNVIKYNSKIFNAFNLKSKNSFYTNYNSSGKLANNSNTINNDKSSSFSYRNNIIFNKSTTTSRTDNFFSNKSNIHNDEENNEPKINTNKIIDDIYSNNNNFNSNNESRNCSSNNLINLNNINVDSSKNNKILNKPIIKERNDTNLNFSINNRFNLAQNKKQYFSPDEKNNKKKNNNTTFKYSLNSK